MPRMAVDPLETWKLGKPWIHSRRCIDAVDERGWTALRRAAYFGMSATVQMLIESGAAVDPREKFAGATALHFAARQSQTATVRMLLEAGARNQYAATSRRVPAGPLGLSF